MVPKVAKKGTSFKGAGQYYLHDKQADTAERVAFTYTENLPTQNPETALKCMAHTAMRQNEIKAANGTARTGRKLTYPVYTYSLSWAPDETPTQEQMIAAGRETLHILGLDDHEVLMVAHNDEPHPHVHLIVNRVHPETGKAASLSKDHLALSRWAEAYEKKHGKIRCDQRVINNEARRNNKFVKHRRDFAKADVHRWRKQRSKDAHYVRQATEKNLSATHKGERFALKDFYAERRRVLYEDKERQIKRLRAQIKDQNRGKWAELYREQRGEWRALNIAQKHSLSRLRYQLKQRADGPRSQTGTKRRVMLTNAMSAVLGRDNPHGALSRKHRAERTALASANRREILEGIEHINRRYRQDVGKLDEARELDKLREVQAQERRALQREHSRQSQDRARDIKSGHDEEVFRKEPGQADDAEFKRRVARRVRKTLKQKESQRGREKDGGRERE